MKSIFPAVVLLCLVGCNPPEARQTEAAKPAESAPAPAAAPTPPADAKARAADCDYVADLFDMLVKKKAEGWTEREGLDELIARGDSSLGYVADGVFGTRYGPGGGAMARNDVLAACRRMAEGGDLY